MYNTSEHFAELNQAHVTNAIKLASLLIKPCGHIDVEIIWHSCPLKSNHYFILG